MSTRQNESMCQPHTSDRMKTKKWIGLSYVINVWQFAGAEYYTSSLIMHRDIADDDENDNKPYWKWPGTNTESALTIARICFSEYVEPSTRTGRPISSENRTWGLAENCHTKCSRPKPAAKHSSLHWTQLINNAAANVLRISQYIINMT